MTKHIRRLVVCAALALSVNVAGGAELIAEFNGSGNQTTAEFTVKAPWILDWRINSDYSMMISFDLDLVDGTTGVLQGSILRAKSLGNGVRMFDTSGTYRLRVNASFIDWYLKVKQLTPEEAELYTPK